MVIMALDRMQATLKSALQLVIFLKPKKTFKKLLQPQHLNIFYFFQYFPRFLPAMFL